MNRESWKDAQKTDLPWIVPLARDERRFLGFLGWSGSNTPSEIEIMDDKDKLIDRILVLLLLLVMAFPLIAYLQG